MKRGHLQRSKLETMSSQRSQSGFTLIEMVIAMVILLSLSFLITNMVISGRSAQDFADRLRRVTDVAQEVLDEMQGELREAVRIFGDDANGQAYEARIAPWTAVPLGSTKMPIISTSATLNKDVAGTEKTGNSLLFVRHAWADTFTCTSSTTYRIDVYRMVRYFLRVDGTGPVPTNPWGLNLAKWVSEPLINGGQIDAISDSTDQDEVLLHLRNSTADDAGDTHAGAMVVWLVGEDPGVGGTFRQILADGSLSTSPQLPRNGTWEIETAPAVSRADILSYRHYSVASNFSQANRGVSTFGIRNDTTAGVGFPHGFEVQVVGSSAARQVLLRLVLVTTNMSGLKAYFAGQIIQAVREG